MFARTCASTGSIEAPLGKGLARALSAVVLSACGSSTSNVSQDAGNDTKQVDAAADATGADTSTALDAGTETGSDAGVGHANGTLGDWRTVTPMALPRANHCSVAAAGYL